MKRTRNLMTALCCSGLLAAVGCTSTGELSVTGMYGSQGQALSGDRCDELLMAAAKADTAEGEEAAKEAYRECVEEALDEDGRDGECRDGDDPTCDVILEEVGDALERIRESSGENEAPNCAAPESNGEEALCHLMAAYEACELDRDNDGDPDVGDRPEEGEPDESEGDRPDEEAGDDGSEGEGDHPIDGKTCEQVRDIHEGAGEEDRAFLERERPDCFESPEGEPDADASGETSEGGEGGEGGEGEPGSEGGDADAFCAGLAEEIEAADTAERKAELQEVYERECTP